MKTNINLIYKDTQAQTYEFTSKTHVRKILKNLCNVLGLFSKTETLEMTVLFTTPEEMRLLNKEFLDKDYPTNILSFPDKDLHYASITENDFIGDAELGDIALSMDVLVLEAKESNTSLENHFTHLLVHAILHLVGYDHLLDEDFDIMKDLEIKILNKLGLERPLIYAEKEI